MSDTIPCAAGPASLPHSGIMAQIGYAAGNLGKSVVWTTFETVLLFYLVAIVGVSPVLAGGLLMAAMICDGIADLFVSYAADRHGRRNTLSHYVIFAAPLCGLAFWGIFLDAGLTGPWRIVHIVVAYILCRGFYTICDVAHNMLIVRVTPTPRDAVVVSGLRLMFSAAGAALVGLASSVILGADTLRQQQHIVVVPAAIGGLLYATLVTGSVFMTRHRPALTAVRSTTGFTGAARALWSDHALRRLFALVAVQASLVPLFVKALPFFAQAVHGDSAWGGRALVTIMVAQAAALPFWLALANSVSPRLMFRTSHGLMLGALTVLALHSGSIAQSVALALLGMAQAGMNMAIWALLPVLIRQGASGTHGLEALPVGVFLAVLKSAAGIGTGVLALCLALAKPDAVLPFASNAPLMLTAFSLGAPALGCCLCVLIARKLPL